MSKELALFLTRFAAALRELAEVRKERGQLEAADILADVARSVFVAAALAEEGGDA